MLNAKEIKDIQSLGHKKSRDEQGLFIAEGPKLVRELAEAVPGRIVRILSTDKDVDGGLPDKLTLILPHQLEKISQLSTPNKVLALIRTWPGQRPQGQGWTLYLDRIQDPGNMGTMIRLADWFGVGDIVVTPGCADHFGPKVVQSTMASIARVNVFMDTDGSWLRAQTRPKLAATLKGEPVMKLKLRAGVLMIGNESQGLSDELLSLADRDVSIPGRGQAESLNAAVATGILLSHLVME